MHSEQLEQQLAAYAGFLDEVSRERLPDLTPNKEIDGDVTVVDLMTRQDEAEGTGSGRPGRPFGGRATWMVAVAAALALIAALAFLLPGGEDGSLETIEPPEVEAEPELIGQPTPAPAEPTEAPPPSIGDRLQEATALESAELLTELYSPAVEVSVEGVGFPESDGRSFATGAGINELIDLRFTECADSGQQLISCEWSLDFSFLEGTVPAQRGTAELAVEGERVVSLDMVSANISEVASGLALYRSWVAVNSGDASDLFTPVGTLVLSEGSAERHQDAARAFLAATDVETDPANFGNLLVAAVRSGDSKTVEAVFARGAQWYEPSFSVSGTQLVTLFSGPLTTELAIWNVASCGELESGEVECEFVLTYPLVEGLGEIGGSFTIRHSASRIQQVDVAFDDTDRAQYLAAIADYQAWLEQQPDASVDVMFFSPELVSPNEVSLELHERFGPQWSATLNG